MAWAITDAYGNLWRLPSDEQLVVRYLRKKNNSLPMPPSPITEITEDFFTYNPWDLPGEEDEPKYFFCARTRRENVINADLGYWIHDVDEDLRIVAPGTTSVVAIKKYWVFHSQQSNRGRWIMHEFSQVRAFESKFTEKNVKEVGEWNLYRMYDQRNAEGSGNEEENDDGSESSDARNSPTSILDI